MSRRTLRLCIGSPVAVMCVLGFLLTTHIAHAIGHNLPFRILIADGPVEGLPVDIALTLEKEGIVDVEVESILLRDGTTVGRTRTGGVDFATGSGRSSTAQAPRLGEVFRVRFEQADFGVSLKPGLYAELVRVTVLRANSIRPLSRLDYRHYQVSGSGAVRRVSADEFSRLSARLVVVEGRTINQGFAGHPLEAGPGEPDVQAESGNDPEAVRGRSEINEP